MDGEEEEEDGGHGGPELQRTGRCGVTNVHHIQRLNQICFFGPLLAAKPPEQGPGTAEGLKMRR